jgi:SacI restriction endonuclease
MSEIDELESMWTGLLLDYEAVEIDERLSMLLRSESVSHRFAVITQIAGVFFDGNRSPFCLQLGEGDEGDWDARSFASAVIVPWLRNHESPLGTSGDPYVGNPLRRPAIEAEPQGVKKSARPLWKALHSLAGVIDEDRTKAERYLNQAIAIIMRIRDENEKPLILPKRMSPNSITAAVEEFLREPSGGERALSVLTAIFEVIIGPLINAHKIERSMINSSDASTGAVGDLSIYDADDKLLVAIEVKERSLALEDVRTMLAKVLETNELSVVFAAPSVEAVDSEEVSLLYEKSFRNRVACHFVPVEEFLRVAFSISKEGKFVEFVTGVETNLIKYKTQPHNRNRWREIISDL